LPSQNPQAMAAAATPANPVATGWNIANIANARNVLAAAFGVTALATTGLATRSFNAALWTNSNVQMAVVSWFAPLAFGLAFGLAFVGGPYCVIVSWQREQIYQDRLRHDLEARKKLDEEERESRQEERKARQEERESRQEERKARKEHEMRFEALKATFEETIAVLLNKLATEPSELENAKDAIAGLMRSMAEVTATVGFQVSSPLIDDIASDNGSTASDGDSTTLPEPSSKQSKDLSKKSKGSSRRSEKSSRSSKSGSSSQRF
jgi:Skp family chaperone for outer membrane proteins